MVIQIRRPRPTQGGARKGKGVTFTFSPFSRISFGDELFAMRFCILLCSSAILGVYYISRSI